MLITDRVPMILVDDARNEVALRPVSRADKKEIERTYSFILNHVRDEHPDVPGGMFSALLTRRC